MILVDELRKYPRNWFSGHAVYHRDKSWCHMVSDESEEELHAFAEELGLKREWYQGDHYDLTEGMRNKAVAKGAKQVTGQELVCQNACSRTSTGSQIK